jgi:hypothetical protein
MEVEVKTKDKNSIFKIYTLGELERSNSTAFF